MSRPKLVSLSRAGDKTQVGGKAFALHKMVQAGFNVPAGFVVPAASYDSMDQELKNALLDSFDKLNIELVAVRSSALNEDGQTDAWAGQLDTFLNTNREALIDRVRDCWQSANSDRAKAYAQQKSIETGNVAVIVQSMIQSEVSGVAFSVHPILQDSDKVIIEAGFGLGEAVVSGEITPDTYIVSKTTSEILESHISKQSKQLIRTNTGNTTWKELGDAGSTQKLTNQLIVELSQTVSRLEKFFGHPVDVEWALYQGKLYILQSRPITNLTN